jgi:ABC-type transporter Mla subunit MlaD
MSEDDVYRRFEEVIAQLRTAAQPKPTPQQRLYDNIATLCETHERAAGDSVATLQQARDVIDRQHAALEETSEVVRQLTTASKDMVPRELCDEQRRTIAAQERSIRDLRAMLDDARATRVADESSASASIAEHRSR